MTIRIHSRYRIPILNTVSLYLKIVVPPHRGGVSPSTSAFQAKIFMVSLSKLGVGLPFCLKDLWSPKLGYAPKIKNKFVLKTEVKFFELEDSV